MFCLPMRFVAWDYCAAPGLAYTGGCSRSKGYAGNPACKLTYSRSHVPLTRRDYGLQYFA